MMFLIRVAFWLSIVVLLLPTGHIQQATPTPQIGAVEAFSAAGAAVADMGQFCTRQPDACAAGSQATAAFGHKAQASAKMIYDFFSEKLGRSERQSIAAARPAAAGTDMASKGSQNTLTPADRSPVWRGP